MKHFNRLFGAAIAIMICLNGAPAQAASAQEGTLLQVTGGRVQFGVAQSSRTDKAVEGVTATMAALRTRGTNRLYLPIDRTAAFLPVRPITATIPETRKP